MKTAAEREVFDLEAIRAGLSLKALAEREGVVWRRSGLGWVACCPFHQERSGSFNIKSDADRKAHCFGCGWHGDIFDFHASLRGIDCKDKEAFRAVVRELAVMAGVGPRYETAAGKSALPKRRALPAAPKPRTLADSGKPRLPEMRHLRPAELETLAALRGLRVDALEAAVRDRRLGFSWWPVDPDLRPDSRTKPSWVITDPERWCAQFRPMDGSLYKKPEGEFKSWSTRNIAWPVGAAQTGDRERIVVMEGGADMLACYQLLLDCGLLPEVAVWCFFGTPHPAAEGLYFARGKRVRIIADNDPPQTKEFKRRPPLTLKPGLEGAARWTEAFAKAGAAEVGTYDLEPLGVKDLNDLVRAGTGDVDLGDMFNF